MALNIPEIASAATDTAWSLGITAMTAAVLQTGRTTTVDHEEDTEALTWDSETSLDALIYDVKQSESESDERSTPAIGWTATALIRVADLTADSASDPTHESRLVAGGNTWEVTGVAKVPTAPILILSLRR